MVAPFLRMERMEKTKFDEFCFDPFKVKEAVEHSEGGVMLAYVVV